jgi:CRISPR-associated endoribonuclease Cas6
MRFKLTLQINRDISGNLLPLNYQYPLSAWIYNVIGRSDSRYSEWLHENGYMLPEHKRFKFFVFSNLKIQNAKVITDRLSILSNTVDLYLSFLPEKSTEEFIKGLFSERDFSIGDKNSQVHFSVQSIEMLASPDFTTGEASFKTISPTVISIDKEQYVSPEAEDYGRLLVNNLKEKYRAFYQKPFDGNQSFEFELLSQPKWKLITIKANTEEQTKVKGYLFSFRLKASLQLLRMLYEAGAGEKGSLGFGMMEALEYK